jgi:hypothetical protein
LATPAKIKPAITKASNADMAFIVFNVERRAI